MLISRQHTRSTEASRSLNTGFHFLPKIADQTNHIYKKERDVIKDKTVCLPGAQNSFFSPVSNLVQQKCAYCEEEDKKAQRKEMNSSDTTADHAFESYVGNLNGSGHALSNEMRNFYEPRFGYDFSNVKVHTDSVAAKSAQSINALAYTTGNNIVFNNGQYSPDTDSGKRLLGHELTHVVQQTNTLHNLQAGTPSQILQRQTKKKKDNNPYGPEKGTGLLQGIDETVREQEQAERFQKDPGTYDPEFIPKVTVDLAQERYLYDFRISGFNLDQVCKPPDLATDGCVHLDTASSFDDKTDVKTVSQSLKGQPINSPVEIHVVSFPVTSRLYVASENIGNGETLNHELHHLVANYHLFGMFKERVARAIRGRIVDNRKLVVQKPEQQEKLISKTAIEKIVKEESDPYYDAIGVEYKRRHDEVHAQERLPKIVIPPSWRNFKMPPVKPGISGSFT